MEISKPVRVTAIVLSAIGALNIGINKLVPTFNLLNFVPAGLFSVIVYAAVGLSGAVVLYELYEKKI
jgi:uncharacterized membrane protein YuzA (DUF378 family)